jgi:hypothetical protein
MGCSWPDRRKSVVEGSRNTVYVWNRTFLRCPYEEPHPNPDALNCKSLLPHLDSHMR